MPTGQNTHILEPVLCISGDNVSGRNTANIFSAQPVPFVSSNTWLVRAVIFENPVYCLETIPLVPYEKY